jgi:hypothetical protein
VSKQPTLQPTGLRLPSDVRQQVEATAAKERRSMNSQIVILIERGLRAPETKTAIEAATPIAAE